MPSSILIVDDEKHTREGLSEIFAEEFDVYTAANAEEAFRLMEGETMDVVLTDLRMAGPNGLKVIDKALSLPTPPVTLMMTAYGNVPTAVEAMRRGAYDFLTKPLNLEKLELTVKRALRSRELETENATLHARLDQKFSFEGVIGHSGALEQVLERVRLVAPSKATILLEGETGTGKELIAQAIHQNSPRARAPFVAVHAAALPANLLESELFGVEKGAFTGAAERRPGRFEAADGGTIFLDEVGEIDASTQVKLLRFLETRSFERLGSVKPLSVDVRLVAATNRDLEKMVKEGTFREDLYYRLNVVRIPLPSLRERVEDIPLLIDHYLRYFAEENGMKPPSLDPATIQLLQRYRWPGNIRELRNFAENTVVLHPGGKVGVYDLDARFHETGEKNTEAGSTLAAAGKADATAALSVEENEKRLLAKALREARGNRTQAAKLLGISRRTLHRKLDLWPELDTARATPTGED